MKRTSIPAREYARRHRMSLFQVVKQVNEGKLEGETREVDGVKTLYIDVEETEQMQKTMEKKPTEKTADSPALSKKVEVELRLLREEIAALRRQLRECCKSEENSKAR